MSFWDSITESIGNISDNLYEDGWYWIIIIGIVGIVLLLFFLKFWFWLRTWLF